MKEKMKSPNEKQYSMFRVARLVALAVLCFGVSKFGVNKEQIVAAIVMIMGIIDITIGLKCQQECESWKNSLIAGICLIAVAILDFCNIW